MDEPHERRAPAGPSGVLEGLHDNSVLCFCWDGVMEATCMNADYMLGGETWH